MQKVSALGLWLAMVALGIGCGAETTSTDMTSAGVGGASGSTGSGGSGGGQGGTGGMAGATTDAGPSVACTDDGGMGLARAARHCAMDSDCQIAIAQSCCGADGALGIAKAEATAYASCVPTLGPNACQGLGCAKFLGYRVDTGEMTDFQAMGQPIDQVAVHCKNEVCTTSVVARDAASD
jgi:hypothetical protein